MITEDSDGGRAVLRHSTAHVLAQAVLQLWPGAHYAIGPSIADGFYYDFELPGGATFSDDDLERIEEKMRAIMAEDQPFVREEHTVEDGLALFADQPFKREIIEGVAAPFSRRGAVGRGVARHRPRRHGGERVPQRATRPRRRRPRRRRRADLRRPVPGPARGLDGPARALQAPAGGRRLLARRRASPPAAAHLRNRVGVRQGAGRTPPSPGGGRTARPPPHRGGARPVLVPARDRLGPGGVPSQGGHHPAC